MDVLNLNSKIHLHFALEKLSWGETVCQPKLSYKYIAINYYTYLVILIVYGINYKKSTA